MPYTWGRASYQKGRSSLPTDSTTLNLERCKVQWNLYDAIRYLDHYFKERQCLFWVDAIYINQENTDEINAQVKEMKDIYHSG